MEVARLKQTFQTCPGGTPPIQFGGRLHCFNMQAPGFGGTGRLGRGLGDASGGGLLLFAALAVGVYYAFMHRDKVESSAQRHGYSSDAEVDEDARRATAEFNRHRKALKKNTGEDMSDSTEESAPKRPRRKSKGKG